MTNLNSPGVGFDPNHGRRAVSRFAQDTSQRAREIASSRPFFAFLCVAAAIVGLYYFLIAAPIYVSESSFVIRGRETSPIAGGLLGAIGAGSGPTSMETSEINKYVSSYEMLEKLDQRFNLRALYSKPRLDLFNHMNSHVSKEGFLSFYHKMVRLRIDHDTNIITVEARSFDPKSAQNLAEAVLGITADYVDSLSGTVRRDTLKASELELQKAEASVRESRLAMTQYRVSTGMLDPVSSAAAATGSVESMRNEIGQARAEMAGLLTYNQPSSPAVAQLRAKVASLEAQMAQAQNRMTNPAASGNMAQQLYQYEGLMVSNDYAERQLVSALASYDQARSLADQRERFLVRIISPHLPDRPSEPKRLLAFIKTMLVLIAGYGIVALAIAGIRDHQGI